METRPLGRTGLDVSRIILDCGNFGGIGSAPAVFGQGESEEEAFAIMDAAWSMGIRDFDTADVYGGGRSEMWIGRWRARHLLALRGRGVCLAEGCGTYVSTARPLRGARRRVRADYCNACRRAKPFIVEPDKKAIKAVLDAAAARTFSNGPQRPRARILARG